VAGLGSESGMIVEEERQAYITDLMPAQNKNSGAFRSLDKARSRTYKKVTLSRWMANLIFKIGENKSCTKHLKNVSVRY
jgi:hypothetical protein